MPASIALPTPEPSRGDQLALRMMLSYVEAECIRIGALDAARLAALAAEHMACGDAVAGTSFASRPRRRTRLQH